MKKFIITYLTRYGIRKPAFNLSMPDRVYGTRETAEAYLEKYFGGNTKQHPELFSDNPEFKVEEIDCDEHGKPIGYHNQVPWLNSK